MKDANPTFKVTIEKINKQTKKCRIQNIDFLSLKSLSPGQVLESSNSLRYHWIFKLFVANFKTRGPGAKWYLSFRACLFYHFNFERNYDVLKWNSSYFLLNENINFPKNQTESKMENPKHVSREMNLELQIV